jgi:type IV secretory pathway ATPase VirB11/archaellum biosynthesis ATPase
MKETNERNESERLHTRSEVLAIAEKLNVHCNKVKALVSRLEAAQINKTDFSLSQTFYTTKSEVMTKAINNLLETYETLRRDVREFAQIGYVSFENAFPELDVNFETYYSVAASLLNLTFQMQIMGLYCYRCLEP